MPGPGRSGLATRGGWPTALGSGQQAREERRVESLAKLRQIDPGVLGRGSLSRAGLEARGAQEAPPCRPWQGRQ